MYAAPGTATWQRHSPISEFPARRIDLPGAGTARCLCRR